MLKYESIEEIITKADSLGIKISELIINDQVESMQLDKAVIYKRMSDSFDVMCESVKFGQAEGVKSMSGLTGAESNMMLKYNQKTNGGIMGGFIGGSISRALGVSLCNAAMGKIVATPTAGSCGILPSCLVSMYEEKGFKKKDIIMSMFTAAGFGMVIAGRASISGAEGGCQAECGSASAMAAAALVELMGGSPCQSAEAAAFSLVNQMGLVCDPVAGLVEIPCIYRNVSGAMIAFSSADMALAGLKLQIPVDECIDSMRNVGNALPCSLKETAMGGIAVTATAQKLKEQVFG